MFESMYSAAKSWLTRVVGTKTNSDWSIRCDERTHALPLCTRCVFCRGIFVPAGARTAGLNDRREREPSSSLSRPSVF